jgi:2-hydroxychromene-2-carboxylate isomerase
LEKKIMARSLNYYFSLLSPWAYLGHAPLGRIAANHDVVIDYRPVDLIELFPETGGLPLPKRHPSRQRYRILEMKRWREARDAPLLLKPKNWPFDFKLADRLALVAGQGGPQDKAHAFISMAFRAVWVEDRNLADEGELTRLLEEGGYAPRDMLTRARDPQTIAAHEGNKARAMEDGVFGSPSYVLDGEVFWGQDRLDMLNAALTSGRAAFTPDL